MAGRLNADDDVAIMMVEAGGTEKAWEWYQNDAPHATEEVIAQGLDAAKTKAEASCKSSSGGSLFVQMGFGADGRNRGAALSNPKLAGTPEAKCVLKIFRAVRIPAFDPATKPGGLGRMVKL